MVEENFKIGLKVELDTDSLESIARQVEKEIREAITRGTKSGRAKSPVTGGSATIKSAREAIEIKGNDFARQIQRAIVGGLAGLEVPLEKVSGALDRLQRTMDRASKSSGSASPDAPREERRIASRTRAISTIKGQLEGLQSEKDFGKQLEKENKLKKAINKLQTENLRDARKLEDAQDELVKSMKEEAAAHREAAKKTRDLSVGGGFAVSGAQKAPREQLAEKQVGASNIRRGANIEATRAGGSERTAGGSGSKAAVLSDAPRVRDARVGTKEDQPSFKRNQEKSLQARERVGNIQQGAEFRVASINESLNQLKKAILNIPTFKGMDPKQLFSRLGLPTRAEVGPGAAPQVKEASGQIRVIGGIIDLFGGELKGLTTSIKEQVNQLIGKGGRLEEIGRTARRDPEMAISRLRGDIKSLLQSSPVIEEQGRPRKGFQKGGEFTLRYELTDEEKERLSVLKNEAEIIGELNRAISQYIANNETLRNSLRKAGIETIATTGQVESKAANIQIIRSEPEKKGKPGKIESVELPVQTRNLPTVGLGGEGGLARWAREFLVTQISDVRGGIDPSVKGYMEQQLEEAGMILKGGFKEYMTVLADPDLIPEIREDQFLFDPKVVDMAMEEFKSVVVRSLAEGITPGKKLTKGEVMGTIGEGEEIEQVLAKFPGGEAVVERLETVMIDGIEGIRVVYKQLNETVSGMKLVERSGIKGIARSADLEKMGFAKGTGVVMSMEGLVKRHGLRTAAEMMSNAIAEATGRGAQEIADHIVQSMETGGQTIGQAVKAAAAAFGAKGFTGRMKVGGPLGEAAGGNLEVLAGKMAWARAPREGETGPLKAKLRYIDPAAMASLEGRAETASMVEQWRKEMATATKEHSSLIMSLKALRGEVDLTEKGLRVIRPEQLNRLPPSGATEADFTGSLLDPYLEEAFAMPLPQRGGGEKLMYVPPIGGGVGERGSFKSKIGTTQATGISTALDRIAEQAEKVRGLRGEIPITEGSEAMREAAEVTGRAIKAEVAAIKELGLASEEGAARAQKFLATFMPIINSLSGSVGLKYQSLGKGGEPAGPIREVKSTASEYVGKMKGMGQLYAIQDILAERAGTVTGKPGAQTRSIAEVGKVHKDVEVLAKAMTALDIRLDGTSEAAEKAIDYLEKLEAKLHDTLTLAAAKRGKPEKEERRSIAAAAEGGVSFAPMGVALEFRTDVSKELEKVSTYLTQMAASGQDVGEAVAAFQKISSAQQVDLPAIDRNSVLINENDFKRLVASFSKRLNISQAEASSRLMRPGLLQRYPITGEQSFSASKLRPVSGDVLPEGKLGIAGTMAISAAEDLKKMLSPLERLEASLIKAAEGANYTGPAAEEAAAKLQELAPVIDNLRTQFIAAALNLDFDGDKVAFHADMAREAARGLQTFGAQVSQGSASFRKALVSTLSTVKGPGGPGTSLEDIERLFAGGKAKGRTGDFKSAVSWPASPDKAFFESMAHTGPKKSVGLLSDLFNQVALAVNAGSKQVGGALHTFVGQLLLGINESMAAKHGSGGAKGPSEFLDALRKGQIGEIQAAMKTGEGYFGKLASQNEQMVKALKKDLGRLAVTEGAAGLMSFVEKEGLGIEIDPKNLAGSIDKILQEASIDRLIVRLFETLKANVAEGMVKAGATLEEAQELVKDALMPTGKSGFIKGLDLKGLVAGSFPGYAMTRNKGQAAIKELEPADRAGRILDLIPGKAASEAVDRLSSACSTAASCNEDLSRAACETTSCLRSLCDTTGKLEASDISKSGAEFCATIDSVCSAMKRTEITSPEGTPAYKMTKQQFLGSHSLLDAGPELDSENLLRSISRKLKDVRGAPGLSLETLFKDEKKKDVAGQAVVSRGSTGLPEAVLAIHKLGDELLGLEVAVSKAAQGKGLASRLYSHAEASGLDVNSVAGQSGFTEAGAKLAHRRAVSQALEEGKSVSPAVLKDYPHLQRPGFSMSDINLEPTGPDPKEAAKAVRDRLKNWMREVLGSGVVKPFSEKELSAEPLLAKTKGMFSRGSRTEAGAEGTIRYSRDYITKTKSGVELLGKIIEGNLSNIDVSSLQQLTKDLREFLGTIAHEGVHKANKAWADSVNTVIQELQAAAGQLGQHVRPILKVMGDHLGVNKLVEEFERLKSLQAGGATQAEVSIREQKPSGEFGRVKRVVPIGDAINQAAQDAYRSVAEELMAYSVQPEAGARFMDQLPQAVKDFVSGQVDRLKQQAGPEGDILRKTLEAREEITNLILGDLTRAVAGAGPPDVKGDVSKLTASLSDFPDAARFNRALEMLAAHERVVLESVSTFGGMSGARRSSEGGLERMEPFKTTRMADKGSFQKIKETIENANADIQEAIADPEMLSHLEQQVERAAGAARAKLGKMRKDPTIAGEMGGITGQEEYVNIIREFQKNVALAFTEKARNLQRQIMEMRQKGLEQTPDFGQLVEEFTNTISRLHNYASETLQVRGTGRGTIASYAAGIRGGLLGTAAEAGIAPTKKTTDSMIAATAGTDAEREDFLKRLRPSIDQAVASLQDGEKPIKVWATLFQTMLQYSATFKDDIVKVVEILAKLSRFSGISGGEFSHMANAMKEVSDNAKQAAKATKDVVIKGPADITGAMSGGTKGQRQAGARASGLTFEDSINAQFEEMSRQMEERRLKLQKFIETPGYKSTGQKGKRFEGQSFEVLDPESGKVIQKYATEFVRHGGEIRGTLKQIGQASKGTGEMLSTAFRRVVQWGFASGIIYGTLRAFRAAGQAIVDVQDRIAELQKVMDTSVTDFQAMQDAAVGFAKQFGQPINDVIDGMVVYGQQGLKMSEITERTKSTMLAMNTTTLKATEATEAITSVMKVFGDELSSSQQAVDSWAAVAAKHAVGASELAIAVQRAGGAAKASGVNFNDLLGITTAIGSVTRQTGKELATGTKFMLRTMRTPTAQKSLLGVGVKSQDSTGSFRPAMDVLGEIAGRWDDLTISQKLNVSQSIAGIRHYNQFIVLMENWQEALDASTNSQDSQGFAARKSAIAMQTFSKQMQVLRATVIELALGMGKAVLPAATMIVKALQNIVSVANYLPDSFKLIGTAGAAIFLSAHKGADLFLDTIEAIGGANEGLRNKFKEGGIAGLLGSGLSGLSKIPKSIGGVAKDIKTAMSLPVGQIPLGNVGDTLEQAEGLGVVGTALLKVRSGANAAADGFKALSLAGKALVSSTVIGLALGLAALGVAYMKTRKTGKEVEDQMFDQIGVAQDQISSLQSQGKHLQKVSKSWADYASAIKTATNPAKLGEAMRSGTFKGPLTALKEYKDTVYEVGVALATLDPSSIEGISETGEYIYNASSAMGVFTASAVDAKKATIAALQTDTIEAYAAELSKAKGLWANFVETISLGGVKMDLLTQLDEARSKVKELGEAMRDDATKGILSSVSAQLHMNEAVKEELALRGETILIAQNIKRVFEQLPTFQSEELASSMINSKKMTEAIGTGVQGGAFGRDASVGSVKMSYMARNLGLGGVVGTESTSNSIRFMEQLISKGLTPSKGAATKEGSVSIISKEAGKQLLDKFGGGTEITSDFSERARVLITGMDEMTGEVIYYFENAAKGSVEAVRASELGPELQTALSSALTVDPGKIKEAAEKTERLLTLQATGALAGMHIPKGGLPDIGPGTFRELSTDQRVMGALPEEMQRLSNIQSELAEITKKYNEDLGDNEEEVARISTTIKDNINIMGEYEKQLVIALKTEEFYYSAIGHTQTAIEKLAQSLLEYGRAARDASIEEETRTQLLKHTSGALSGLSVVPQLDFGKGMRELSGQERLQKQLGPGFSKTLSRFAGVQKEHEAGVEKVIDLRKQEADLYEMIRDLDTAGGNLNSSLEKSITKELTGATEGDQYIAEIIQKQGDSMLSEMQKQTPLLDRMLQYMEAEAKVATGADKQQVFGDLLGKLGSEKVAGLLGSGDKKALFGFLSDRVGLTQDKSDTRIESKYSLGGRDDWTWKTDMAKIAFKDPEGRGLFEEKRAELQKAYQQREFVDTSSKNFSPSNREKVMNEADADVAQATAALMSIPEVSDAAKKYAESLVNAEGKTKKQVDIEEKSNRINDLKAQLLEKRNEALAKFNIAEQSAIAETEKAAQILKAGEAFRLAVATQDFATAIESNIAEFEKAEMLAYQKKGSVLEGAFARVGRAGFRTEFEQRRMDLEAPMRPQTYDEMRQRQKDLETVDFDEREARIKEKQDVEVATLRQQQSQAEKIRETIADAIIGGSLTPDAESSARSYMDTLTQQLATSEQASMRGGELFFEGVPALEESRRFLAQIQEEAKKQARAAEAQFQVEIHKKGNQDLVNQGSQQIGLLQQIVNNTQGGPLAQALSGPQSATSAAVQSVAGALPSMVPTAGKPSTWQEQVERAALTPLPGASTGPITPEDFLLRGAQQDFQSQMQTYADRGPSYKEPLDMSVYKREGRKYGNTLRDSFVQEQTFSSPAERTPELLPESPDDYLKRVMSDYAKRGQTPRVIQPTGSLIPEEIKRGDGPINLTDYYHGASNSNQISRMQTRQETGNSKLSTALVGDQEGRTPGPSAPGERAGRGADTGGDAQSEALQRIAESVEATRELISNLGNTLQFPADLGSQIENVGNAITERLGETLSVEVSNAPLAVTVDGLQEAFSSAIDGSAISSVGASVSDALGRLALLESVVDPQGSSIEELIAQATTELNQTIDQTNIDLNTQIGRIDELEGQAGSQIDAVELENRFNSLQSGLDELDPRVSALESGISDIQSGLNDTTSRVSQVEDTVTQLGDSFVNLEQEVFASVLRVDEFGQTIDTFDSRISSAEAASSSASTAVTDIQRGLISLQNTVEQNKQLSQVSLQQTNTSIDRAETQIQSIQQTILTLQRKSESALSVAQQAINRANQKT